MNNKKITNKQMIEEITDFLRFKNELTNQYDEYNQEKLDIEKKIALLEILENQYENILINSDLDSDELIKCFGKYVNLQYKIIDLESDLNIVNSKILSNINVSTRVEKIEDIMFKSSNVI